ncbi:MAG: cytochrome c [Planctomycetes bacterium]|nr:cytochrome c [Planctomycetota bacterium]
MRRGTTVVFLLLVLLAPPARPQEPELYDPYGRVKNGPPLSHVFHKARPAWIKKKLLEPKHHDQARMPDFGLSQDEALDIMAYLASLAGERPAPLEWPAWADRPLDDLDASEFEAADALMTRGDEVWRGAGCAICHRAGGAGGEVDLRTGGIDLAAAGVKLDRNWLYRWIENPRDYFPRTLMPRFTMSDEDRRALVEFLLRDDRFREIELDEPPASSWSILEEPQRAARGRRIVETSRCIVCHDVEGVPDLYELPSPDATEPVDPLAKIVWDRRCLTCHRVSGRGGTYAPDLTAEGSRLQEEWIARFVQEPGKEAVRNLVLQMPRLGISEEEARAVASYMARFRVDPESPVAIPGGPLTTEDSAEGREVFQRRGCVACHAPPGATGGIVGPDLGKVPVRLRPGHVWRHLLDPHASNPYSPEPAHDLTPEEARHLAAYLLQGRGE